jgi:DNA-binding transcriptional ArsR family regulator
MLDESLRAIVEPRRRSILQVLRQEERSVGEIAAHFDVTRSAISQHLGILTEAGLVSVRQIGTRRLYRARPEGLAELRAFIEQFWSERLEHLAQAAEAEERRLGHGDPTDP